MNGASNAITITTLSSASPNTATGLARKSDTMRRSGVWGRRPAGIGSTAIGAMLLMRVAGCASSLALREAHARIEGGVQQVDEEIDHDEERHDHEQVGDDHGTVQQV